MLIVLLPWKMENEMDRVTGSAAKVDCFNGCACDGCRANERVYGSVAHAHGSGHETQHCHPRHDDEGDVHHYHVSHVSVDVDV